MSKWLGKRGWICCDKCGRGSGPTTTAGGAAAGHYDICNRHDLPGIGPSDPRDLISEEEQRELTDDLKAIHDAVHPCWRRDA
jgi:hypothetical protein